MQPPNSRGSASDRDERQVAAGTNGALLLEEDVVLLPEPGVGQVARVGLGLAGEEGVLGNVYRDVLWWRNDERRA